MRVATARRDRNDLVVEHYRLAYKVATRFADRGEALEDLTQVALLGLVKAADRFDARRGVRFATYATAFMLGELKRHFRDRRWSVHVARPLQEAYLRVRDAADELTQELGHSPT